MPNVFSRGIAVDPSSFRRQLKVDYMEDVINDNPLTRKLYAKVQDMNIRFRSIAPHVVHCINP
jgi:hypothetical protein